MHLHVVIDEPATLSPKVAQTTLLKRPGVTGLKAAPPIPATGTFAPGSPRIDQKALGNGLVLWYRLNGVACLRNGGLILNMIKYIYRVKRSRPVAYLIPVKNRSLTPVQYGALADVPPKLEWLANITNPKTRRNCTSDSR